MNVAGRGPCNYAYLGACGHLERSGTAFTSNLHLRLFVALGHAGTRVFKRIVKEYCIAFCAENLASKLQRMLY